MSGALSSDQVATPVDPGSGRESTVGPTRPARSTRRQHRIREIDFSRPTKFTQEQQRNIERAHEAFGRAVGTRLTNELRTEVELEVINLAQLTLSGALSSLPSQTLYGIAQTAPLGTFILVCLEQDAATAMVERLIGGTPGSSGVDRELTDIELALARRAFGSVVYELSVAWQELFGLELELTALESLATNAQIAPVSEPTLALTLEMRNNESSSAVSVIVPFRSIEPVVDRLVSGPAEAPTDGDDGDSADAVRAAVQIVEVELRVEVAHVDLPLDRLLALDVGDVLSLGAPAAHGVTVFANQASIQRARPGRRGSSRAIEILGPIGGQS